jgi:hypothetical protein
MASRVSAALAGALIALSGCATTSSVHVASGAYPGEPVPLVNPPHDWGDVFEQLVDRCPAPEHDHGWVSGDVLFTAGYVVVSLGIGAYIFTQRELDAATIAAGGVGVVAGAGELYTLFASVRARREAHEQFEARTKDWRAQWAAAEPAQRQLILDAVAASCGEEAELAQDRVVLGQLVVPR